jgi:ferredoxin-type protein NapG
MSGDDQVTRRDWLRGRFFGRETPQVRESPARMAGEGSARYRQAFPVLRPPGAIDEEAFLTGCTRCEACIEACPHDAIVHAPLRFRRAAGTPMIDPIGQPCWLCRDYPCIAACEPGVLSFDLPVKMGLARIDVTTCLAWQGTACSECVEQCPVEGAMQVTAGKPRVVEESCTGCGVCQHVCPAPHNAVLLMPVAQRPLPAKGDDHVDAC